jgi:hypothetical protein
MGRLLTFRQLRTEKGWPHSRQWTGKLVKEKKIPAPKKRPGGSVNVWDETEWNDFQDTFVRALPQPVQLALTAALTEALSATSIDGIVAAIGQLRTILESEGAAANDVVVNLKARLPAPIQAASETATLPDTS